MSRGMIGLLALLAAMASGCGTNESTYPAREAGSAGDMVLVPAGIFLMGDSSGQADETPHQVSLRSFYLDASPVTQEFYEKILGVNPSKQKGTHNPVERTQWTDAVLFCNRCSELEGLTPCYNLSTWVCNFDSNGYRLPAEAEWEYACRAGSTAKYCCGDSDAELEQYAWFKPGSGGKTRPVGQKQPNRWGLYDMHGNVWQWCNDWYSDSYYQQSPMENPHGPATGKMRVLRGGAWDCTAEKLRSAYRHKEFPVYSDACFGADSYGFRRARYDAPRQERIAAAPTSPVPEKPIAKHSSATSPAPAAGKLDPATLKGTIVFVSDRSGTLKIWRMHASGKEAKQLTQGDEPEADPRFAPDGKQILFTRLRGGFPEVWLMNRDGSAAKFVTKGAQASWAPDGRSIVFIRDNQTYVRVLANGTETRVTPAAWQRCGVPAFSPDGKRLAVASRHLGDIGVFILSLDGKENYQLKTADACCTPQWSKDGKKILCQTVQGHIHHVALDGSDWDQVTFGADVQHDARYSPDGTMIVFCRAPAPDGPWQICVKKLDGDEDEFIALTTEGSNRMPDWHSTE